MLDNTQRTNAKALFALRAELLDRGLDAFILPRFDAHQGSMLHPTTSVWPT